MPKYNIKPLKKQQVKKPPSAYITDGGVGSLFSESVELYNDICNGTARHCGKHGRPELRQMQGVYRYKGHKEKYYKIGYVGNYKTDVFSKVRLAFKNNLTA